MTWAGITNPFLAPLPAVLSPEVPFFTVIVPSGFCVTMAGVLLEDVTAGTVFAVGGARQTHPDKSARIDNSRISDSFLYFATVRFFAFSGHFDIATERVGLRVTKNPLAPVTAVPPGSRQRTGAPA